MTTSLSLKEIIEYLDTILPRESVECKQYDYKAIQYIGETTFSVTINETLVSENIDKIILYTNGECVGLLCTTPHLTQYKYNITSITSLEIT